MPRYSAIELRERKTREREFIRDGIVKTLNQDSFLRNTFEAESRVDGKRKALLTKKEIEERNELEKEQKVSFSLESLIKDSK